MCSPLKQMGRDFVSSNVSFNMVCSLLPSFLSCFSLQCKDNDGKVKYQMYSDEQEEGFTENMDGLIQGLRSDTDGGGHIRIFITSQTRGGGRIEEEEREVDEGQTERREAHHFLGTNLFYPPLFPSSLSLLSPFFPS